MGARAQLLLSSSPLWSSGWDSLYVRLNLFPPDFILSLTYFLYFDFMCDSDSTIRPCNPAVRRNGLPISPLPTSTTRKTSDFWITDGNEEFYEPWIVRLPAIVRFVNILLLSPLYSCKLQTPVLGFRQDGSSGSGSSPTGPSGSDPSSPVSASGGSDGADSGSGSPTSQPTSGSTSPPISGSSDSGSQSGGSSSCVISRCLVT